MKDNSSKFFDFELRPQQASAFSAFKDFINDEDGRVFVLKGYAGTGKTTLMSGFAKWLAQEDITYKLMASTGRAAKILSDKTGVRAGTVHGLIYKFSGLSEDLSKMDKLRTNKKVDDKGQVSLLFDLFTIESEELSVYITDEASMIADAESYGSFAKYGSGKLLSDLLAHDVKGKFVFVGDPCQLPPVGQAISPSLSPEYLKDNFAINAVEYELTEIMRQSRGSGIIRASLHLRDQYEENPPIEYPKLKLRNFDNIRVHDSDLSLVNEYVAQISKDGYGAAALLCLSNRSCTAFNRNIRGNLFQTTENLVEGDLLLVTQNNYLVSLVNGDLVKVIEIGSNEYRVGLSFRQVVVEEIGSGLTHNVLLAEDILNSSKTNLDSKQQKDLLIDFSVRMKAQGIKQKSDRFNDQMMKDPYLNALRAVYGYALTCHKGQGGEWPKVYLYLDKGIYVIPKPGIYQWWYTAVTRAQQELHVVDNWFIT